MNKKITVKTPHGKVCYAVFDKERSDSEQICELFGIDGEHGISVEFQGEQIVVTDYYHAEPMAEFDILSIDDTDLPVSLKWNEI